MPKTLTLRLNDDQGRQLDEMIELHPRFNTASKVLCEAAFLFETANSCTDYYRNKLEESEMRVRKLEQVIESARASAVAFVEEVSQEDML